MMRDALIGAALGVGLVALTWFLLSAGLRHGCVGNAEATRRAAAGWVAAHMPAGTSYTCQIDSPCENSAACDASTADRSRVVFFNCTPNGCAGRR